MDLLPPAIGAGDETESKTMTKHTSLSTLSTAELVNVFNLVSDGPEVKRFENRGVALARTAKVLTEKGKTLDGVLVSLGLAPAPVVEAPSPKAVIDQAEAAKGRALTETEQRRLARRVTAVDLAGKLAVRYQSIDGVSDARTFATIEGARRFAHARVGAHPEIGSTYAVSDDGVGKITCRGCTLADLFPEEFTYSRGHAAHFGNRQVSVPDQVADDQRGFADADRPFPALLPRGEGVVTVRIDAEATGLGTGGTGDLVVVAAKVAKSTAPAKAVRKAPKSGNGETNARAHGQTRAIIIAAMSRDGGATAAELYAATGWTQTSWNHQLNVAAKASGLVARKDKVDGATTYALVKG